MRKLLIIFILLVSQFILGNNIFAEQIPVEKVFSDINKNYKYYNELQTLYDRGMIFPDENGKLNPKKLLNRDEFVGISMEVSCKRCISPNTDFSLLKEHSKTQTFYDVSKNNKYYYCIAESDKLGYVKGYSSGFQCEGKEKREDERPFCVDNRITLDEALAVILRNSGIFTIEDNKKVLSKIYSGEITEDLSDDVSPKNNLGQVYTFYGYIQKALSFELKEVNKNGEEKIYKLLEKTNNKIYPYKYISKEEFIRIAYIALKANSCIVEEQIDLAINIDVLDKECIEGKKCDDKSFDPNEDTFDLDSTIGGVCKKGIEDKNYSWTFFNINDGTEVFKKGKYIDNYKFLTKGKWRILLEVEDNCGNVSESFITIVVTEKDKELDKGTSLGVEIDAIPLYGEEDLEVDFEGNTEGGDGNYTYQWDYGDGKTGEGKKPTHIYREPGTYIVTLTVTDGNGKIGTSTVTIVVTEKDTEEDNGLNVQIEADPIIGNVELNVHFDGIISGGDGNYTYEWDFRDGTKGTGKIPNHTFRNPGIYVVTLIVTDGSGNTGEATVVIKVLDFDSCDIDADGDGVMDCDDVLPKIPGDEDNGGAPKFDIPEIEGISLNKCLQEGYNSFIIGNPVCNSCPCSFKLDFIATIRKCDLVFPAITSIDSKNIFSRGNLYKIQ